MTRHLVYVFGLAACARPAIATVHNAPQIDGIAIGREADRLLFESVRLDYQRPFDGKPLDRSKIAALYREACNAGDHHACWMFPLSDQRADFDLEDEASEKAVHANCRAGDVLSCRAVGGGADVDICTRDCSDVELRRDCDRGYPYSCDKLAARRPDEPALAQRTVALFRQGCDALLIFECRWLAQIRRDDVSIVERDRAYERVCEISLKLCLHDAADPIAERDILERQCQFTRGDRQERCFASMWNYLHPDHARAPEPVPGRGERLRQWICAESADRDFCQRPQ